MGREREKGEGRGREERGFQETPEERKRNMNRLGWPNTSERKVNM